MAIEVKCSDGSTNIAINPGPNAKVEAGTQGFFIAQSDDEAKRFVICSYSRVTKGQNMKLIPTGWF